jgi:hypothetical protein
MNTREAIVTLPPLAVNSKSERKVNSLPPLGFEPVIFGTLAHLSDHSAKSHPSEGWRWWWWYSGLFPAVHVTCPTKPCPLHVTSRAPGLHTSWRGVNMAKRSLTMISYLTVWMSAADFASGTPIATRSLSSHLPFPSPSSPALYPFSTLFHNSIPLSSHQWVRKGAAWAVHKSLLSKTSQLKVCRLHPSLSQVTTDSIFEWLGLHQAHCSAK